MSSVSRQQNKIKESLIKSDSIYKPAVRFAEKYLKVAPIGELHKVKWLPEGTELQTDTLIWEGYTAIIDYTENLSGVVIDNPAISDTFSVWFDLIWSNAK